MAPARNTDRHPGAPMREAVAEAMRDPDTVEKKLIERGLRDHRQYARSSTQAQTETLVAQWIEVGKKVNLKE